MMRRLNPLEIKMYNKCLVLMMNKKRGSLVIDDEMIGSRAKDVENKSVSDRKRAREGVKTDGLNCSQVGVSLCHIHMVCVSSAVVKHNYIMCKNCFEPYLPLHMWTTDQQLSSIGGMAKKVL